MARVKLKERVKAWFSEASVTGFLSGRFFFALTMAYHLFNMHMGFSQTVLKMNSFVVGDGNVIKKIDLIQRFPKAWLYFKRVYPVVSFLGILLLMDIFYKNLCKPILKKKQKEPYAYVAESEVDIPPYPYDPDKLQLIIGLRHDRLTTQKVRKPSWVVVPEKGMFMDFLVVGGKGMGKSASAMYPLLKQAIMYRAWMEDEKAGMLILDVKGNFWKPALEFAKLAGREDDVIIIELGGKWKYGPLHKPKLRPLVLAGRIKKVLGLFSARNAADGYWLDKAELLCCECIKLCRLYNNGYVTFVEINRLVNDKTYLNSKLEQVYGTMDEGLLDDEEEELFETTRIYFENEYANLSENTLSIIQSVVTQMTQFFYTDPLVAKTFCPPVEQLNFHGFKEVVDKGKIVILSMNIAEYENLSKTIAAYMKLDFQSEALQRLNREGANTKRPLFFFADEYHEYVTASDADFYALSREARCCNIAATQSFTSMVKTLKDRDTVRTITQNMVNKIWMRTDDPFTIEEAQKLLGKEEKEKASHSISESSGDVKKNRILDVLVSEKASITENINISKVKEFIFEENVFSKLLEMFTGICFLSDGFRIMEPSIVHFQPYFEKTVRECIQLPDVYKTIPDRVQIENMEMEARDVRKQKKDKESIPEKKEEPILDRKPEGCKIISLSERGKKDYEKVCEKKLSSDGTEHDDLI